MAEANHTGATLRCCTRCKESKPATLAFFPVHKPGKYGLHSLCVPCKKTIDAERRARPDQQARQQAWRDANKERVKGYNEAYRAAGYQSTEDVNRWRKQNIDRARAYEREKQRRLRLEPEQRLLCRIRARLRTMVLDKAGRRTEDILGYTSAELRDHIERQFTNGMSWDALLRGEIDIDHIIPVRVFSVRSVDDVDFKACWALSNLRPLWSKENRSKGGKVLTLL